MENNSTQLYTIGHSNLSITRFVELLGFYKIDTIVDVRSSPYSQYNPQFDRETLQSSLRLAGIRYRYAGDYLGGRPRDPACYKNGRLAEGKADYLHLVDYPQVMTKDFFLKGINYLIKLAEENRVAIMCSEEDPSICHRHHLIGKYLTSQGITVWHIRNDGNLVRDQALPNLTSLPPVEQPSLF